MERRLGGEGGIVNDRPTATELIESVLGFLEAELIPGQSDPRLRFHTLVAANVLAIALRELAGEETQLREECALLVGLLGRAQAEPVRCAELRQTVLRLNEQLCEAIGAGAFDEPGKFAELAGLLRKLVVRKLEVANPRYLEALAKQG
jgi:hypothetical protein